MIERHKIDDQHEAVFFNDAWRLIVDATKMISHPFETKAEALAAHQAGKLVWYAGLDNGIEWLRYESQECISLAIEALEDGKDSIVIANHVMCEDGLQLAILSLEVIKHREQFGA